MNFLKRFIFFVGCFLILAIVTLCLGGAIAGAVAGSQDPAHAAQSGFIAGQTFALHFRVVIWLGAMVISAGIVFRAAGVVISMALAAVIYLSQGTETPNANSTTQGLSSPAVPPPSLSSAATLTGRQMTLAAPITVDVPHGKVQIPAGSSVTVLSETKDSVRISLPGGQTAIVSRALLK